MLSGGGCLPLHSLPLVPLRCRHCCCMRQLSQPPACPSKLGVATCLLACACLPAHLQPLCAPSALPAWRLAGSSAARQRRHWPGAPAARWRFQGPARNMASRRQRQRRCLKLNAFCLRPQFCQGSGPHPYPHAITPCCPPACCCTFFGVFRFAPACRASNKVPCVKQSTQRFNPCTTRSQVFGSLVGPASPGLAVCRQPVGVRQCRCLECLIVA